MTERAQRRLAAVVSTDVVGYSRLMERDETGTLSRMKAHRAELWTPAIEKFGGRIVGTAGDSLLVEYSSAVAAVESALEVQQGMARREAGEADDRKMLLRVGINIGEVVIDGDDIFGDGVNVAARLQALAPPGGICISGKVHDEVDGKLAAVFEDAGAHEVKNISRPVGVWRWAIDAPTAGAGSARVAEPLPLPDKPSIVVLPFDNMSGDPEQEYFADGITEDITTELSRYNELFVIARNTAFTYKGRQLAVGEVARELGVHFVLEGSVRKAGSRVRINAQLIDGLSGNHLWAERYDGGIEDIFDLQDQVTHQVVSATVPHIDEAALARMRRGSRVFDRAQDLAWQAWGDFLNAYRLADRAALQSAKEKAYQALALNERCHNAYATICGAAWWELLMQWTEHPDASRKEFSQMADKFVGFFPNSHAAHYHHGVSNVVANRHAQAAQDFRHSIALNPNDAMVLSALAYVQSKLGDLDDAKANAAQAIRLNPKDSRTGIAYLALAQVAFIEDDGDFRQIAEKAIQAQPNTPIRRALMVAHAAEVGDRGLLEQHLQHLQKIAPQFIPGLLRGEYNISEVPEHQEKFLKALAKAVPPD